MKKILIMTLLTGALFAGNNTRDGFFEIGLFNNNYEYPNSTIENEKASSFDSIGIEMNYMDRMSENIKMGFQISYWDKELDNKTTANIINSNIIINYEFNKNKFDYGFSSGFGWRFMQRRDEFLNEYNYILAKAGVYGTYYLTKNITIGADFKYIIPLYSTVNIYREVEVKDKLGFGNGYNLSFPIGLKMDENSWLYLEYSMNNLSTDKNNLVQSTEVNENILAMKIRWKW